MPQNSVNYPQNQANFVQNPQMQAYQRNNFNAMQDGVGQRVKRLTIIYMFLLLLALAGSGYQLVMAISFNYFDSFWWAYIIVSVACSIIGACYVYIPNISKPAGLVMIILLMGIFFFHIGVFIWFLFDAVVYLGYFYDSDKVIVILWWVAVAAQTFPLIFIFVIFFMRRKLQQNSQMNQGVFAPLNQNPHAYAQNPHGQAPVPAYQ
ncbi:unnamed protein product [Moneuplotes crassus]|uniref:Uncharacterized protein n=1 Tax=Euplotes crassus TaxID=5936 RepID=A0AAD1XTR5_EUPCR|nr:unnamed protein product [Moneuplotes crassus]